MKHKSFVVNWNAVVVGPTDAIWSCQWWLAGWFGSFITCQSVKILSLSSAIPGCYFVYSFKLQTPSFLSIFTSCSPSSNKLFRMNERKKRKKIAWHSTDPHAYSHLNIQPGTNFNSIAMNQKCAKDAEECVCGHETWTQMCGCIRSVQCNNNIFIKITMFVYEILCDGDIYMNGGML